MFYSIQCNLECSNSLNIVLEYSFFVQFVEKRRNEQKIKNIMKMKVIFKNKIK